MYSLAEMPRVDIHVHVHEKMDAAKLIRAMNPAGINISVDLSGTRQKVADADDIHKRFKNRILIAPGNYRTKTNVWWSMKDLDKFKDAGCAGTKIHAHYFRGLPSKTIIKKVRRQGELDLPVIGLHIADPPVPGYWRPSYWDCMKDAEKLIRACPDTTIIAAHGMWLMNDDKGLDYISNLFDKYPHFNADISAVFQWWDPPEPTYEKLRKFIIRYKDRLIYGTDGNPRYTRKVHFENSYKILETRKKNLEGFFTCERPICYIQGLGLPKEVLNYIYYWNAAKLVPRVRESLLSMGYVV